MFPLTVKSENLYVEKNLVSEFQHVNAMLPFSLTHFCLEISRAVDGT